MSRTDEIGQLIYVKTAASMLACTCKHVYDMLQDGRLRGVRIGKRGIRVKKESVINFIKDSEIDPNDYFKEDVAL